MRSFLLDDWAVSVDWVGRPVELASVRICNVIFGIFIDTIMIQKIDKACFKNHSDNQISTQFIVRNHTLQEFLFCEAILWSFFIAVVSVDWDGSPVEPASDGIYNVTFVKVIDRLL